MSKRPDEKRQPYRFWVLENLYSADYIPKGLWLSKVNALRFADEADKDRATIAALRAQLAESEAACAGYRAALRDMKIELEGAKVAQRYMDAGWINGWADARIACIDQALQSNPGKAVGDVIEAARAYYEKRKADHLAAVAKEYDEEYAQRTFKDFEISLDIVPLAAALAKLEGRKA